MTRERISKIKLAVKRELRTLGSFPYLDVEDLIGHVLYKLTENRKRAIKFLIIDYLRQKGGRGNNSGASLKKEFPVGEITEESGAFYTLHKYEMHADQRLDFNKFLDTLPVIDRSVLVLKCVWGLNNKEIGHVFGVGESRVCQILSEISEKAESKKNHTLRQFKHHFN